MTENTIRQSDILEVSLVSLCEGALILPAKALVDQIPLSMPQVVTKMPRWFLGFLPWQGLRIPFISFEYINGIPFRIDANSHVLVLKTVTPSLQTKFFAILIQNEPVNYNIKHDSLVDVVGDLSSYELATVRLNETVATIPNIEALEAAMVKLGVLN